MTFDEWWRQMLEYGMHDNDVDKEIARTAWDAAQEEMTRQMDGVVKERDFLTSQSADLSARLAKAEALNREVTCLYCGAHFERTTPEETSEKVLYHIEECEKHPLRKMGLALIMASQERDELLAACKEALRLLEQLGCGEDGLPFVLPEELAPIRAAIAKAEGR